MQYTISRMFQVVVMVAVVSSLLLAQTGTSSITGSVADLTGGALPGVEITVVNQETGARFQTLTNDTGAYRVASLPPGIYRIEAELAGFDRLSRGPITLQVSQTVAIDLMLQVGQIGTTVDVTESAPLIESQSSDIGQAVTRQMLAALPLPNRAASSLAALAPGVVMIDTGTGTAENYPVFSVAGGRARNQTFLLDGGNATNAVGLTRPQQLTSLPVDAMQEFKVIANNYSAEFGHSTGGVVTMSTRSGTNEFHGSIFESLRNDALDARNFFAAKKSPIRLNQFGGALGGPSRRFLRPARQCRPAGAYLRSGNDDWPQPQRLPRQPNSAGPHRSGSTGDLELLPASESSGNGHQCEQLCWKQHRCAEPQHRRRTSGSSEPSERHGDRPVLHQRQRDKCYRHIWNSRGRSPRRHYRRSRAKPAGRLHPSVQQQRGE